MNKTCAFTIFLLLTLLVSTPGCGGVEESQERREVMSYIDDLKDDDPLTRLAAIDLLGRHYDHHDIILPALIEAIRDDDERVRYEALRSLFWFRKQLDIKDVLPDIIQILENPDETPEMQFAATSLLGLMELDANDVDPVVIDLLLGQLQDENPLLRSGAACALANISSIERAIPQLNDALNDEDPSVRGRAAIALGNIGQSAEHAIPRITELLNDEDYCARTFAASALKAYGPLAEGALPAIIEAIMDERISSEDGGNAIGAIAQGEDTVAMLIGWLNDSEDRKLRLAASKALGFLGNEPGVVDTLILILSDEDNVIRLNAAEALGNVEPEPKVIEALIIALDDDDWSVVRTAAQSLGNFGPAAVDALPKLEEISNSLTQDLPHDALTVCIVAAEARDKILGKE